MKKVFNIILNYSPAYIFLFLNMESRKNKDRYKRENVGDLSNIKINNIFYSMFTFVLNCLLVSKQTWNKT